MLTLRRHKPFVLVVGSSHMDVLGDFPSSERRRIDKEGEVFCSIGGSGFNIAVDIANQGGGIKVALYTHVRARSPITEIILNRLREEGVSTRYVFRDPNIHQDSGFIAHRADGELVSAVSSMPVEHAAFDEDTLGRAIGRASVVVAECNLSVTQLTLMRQLCASKKKRLLVGGVSESKCQRIKLISDGDNATPPRITCFSLNMKEARALVGKAPRLADRAAAVEICRTAWSEQVVVTEGKDGWTVYTASGDSHKFEAPKVVGISSTSGAGDAILAAIGCFLAQRDKIDWVSLEGLVDRFVDHVLRRRVASGADLTSLETLGSAYQGFLDQFRRPRFSVGTLIGAIVAVLGLGAALIQAAVSLEHSDLVLPQLRSLVCRVVPSSSMCKLPAAGAPGDRHGTPARRIGSIAPSPLTPERSLPSRR